MQTREVTTSELKGGGYLALPDGNGPHPVVVVIHEAYGLNDNIKDITDRLALDKALTEYNIKHDIKIYPGARHSFFNDTLRSFNRQAADDAWSRVLRFFNEQLG